ncbi:V-type ATP synthase subunit D [Candidatus Velamenicoccus archaeovorus]|uniref:V-type ATP synthase subunit D n=1 Tax=Velamenicoccus archaeovorus TaxID=1930593 RepID=A0A410P6X6_VELA1|nr:V-type ATP synthase subunit D [Candidatus Velamenicoccus archaeovorus]QAT17704.1 V-type ATP synthase subunit D [Candidatus Velamenicoccus archaeovorus]
MKIKLTKGELKRQRDALKSYERYLPTLQLKKQQLQLEILHLNAALEDRRTKEKSKVAQRQAWAGLLTDKSVSLEAWLRPKEVVRGMRNVAGVDLPVFERLVFDPAEYDLFLTPLWVDQAVDALREIVSLRKEIEVLNEAQAILRQELRITTQRVNLFEKVKIPEAEEAIRLIKIYIGDQMTNAVGRSKIAKRKITEGMAYGALASISH